MEAVFRAMLIVVVAAAAAATVYKTVPGISFLLSAAAALLALFCVSACLSRWWISFVMPSRSAICPASTPGRCSNA